MSKFFNHAIDELLVAKQMDLVSYFASLSAANQRSFFKSHTDYFKSKKAVNAFSDKNKFSLIKPLVEEDPDPFTEVLVRLKQPIQIYTERNQFWGDSTRTRHLSDFHYKYPHLVEFTCGADVKDWLRNAPETLTLDNLRYVLKNVVNKHAKDPAAAFGSLVRGAVQLHHIPHLTKDDFEILLSDGDTLLNDLFPKTLFLAIVSQELYPSKEFIETLELNCTLSAMMKDRSSRHATRVAKNLRRAKLLLEIQDACK